MFRSCKGRLGVKTIFLGAALLAYPCATFAQHGGGGGHIGGSAAGGGGLSGGNRATGIENKDDLRDFHQIMAVQASNEQKIAYAGMLQSTAVASTELKAFIEQTGKEHNAPELASHDKTLEDAIETARALNKKFLEGFSEAQKSGLKEITKRLTKSDSDLAQEAKVVDQEVETNAPVGQMLISAQNLDRALTSFQRAQVDLGEEMSIENPDGNSNVAYKLLPVKNSITVANQPMAITTSGVVSKGVEKGDQNTFAVELTTDVSDLQLTIADVLRAQLNKSDRCGERITIQTVALNPQPPASLAEVQLHFERWACFGRDTMNEMAEGSGMIEVKMTPAVGADGTFQLTALIGRIDAEGLVGELLRSGSLGETVRDQVAQSTLSILRQGVDFKSVLPPGARSYAQLQRAQFQGTGSGKLLVVLDGEIRVSDDKLAAITGALKGQSSPVQSSRPELTSR
ncbi:MAG TPA: hypothetical protein VJX47_04470 [Candidatus Sulfotelmatobacter sp.]|nr:hypothetical protein [Candidatus Sulfotelmatobacter sp.]